MLATMDKVIGSTVGVSVVELVAGACVLVEVVVVVVALTGVVVLDELKGELVARELGLALPLCCLSRFLDLSLVVDFAGLAVVVRI